MKQETLAKLTGYTRPTVNAALQALEDVHGLITSETRRYYDGRNAAKVYRLNARVKEIDSGESRVNEVYTDRVNAVDTVRVKDVYNKNQEHRTVNQEPKKRERKADSKNPQQGTPNKEPNKRERKVPAHEFDPATVPLPPQFDRDLFVGFCEGRLKLKPPKPMTELALRMFVKKHAHHDKPTLDGMFRDAIIGGWQNLYERKENKPQRSPAKREQLPTEYREVSAAEFLEGSWN